MKIWNAGSDQKLRELYSSFFKAAKESLWDGKSKLLIDGLPLIRNGLTFNATSVLESAKLALVRYCLEKLGTIHGHWDEILNLSWNATTPQICDENGEIADGFKEFAKILEDNQNQTFSIIFENHLFRFEGLTEKVSIGPVEAMIISDICEDLLKGESWPQLKASIGDSYNLDTKNHQSITFPQKCWRVELSSARSNAKEHGLWMINVAISIVRLIYPEDSKNRVFAPQIGDVEAFPTRPIEKRSNHVIIMKDELIDGNTLHRTHYVISQEIVTILGGDDVKRKISVIFDPKENSLGERFSKGLGWLTRARQAEDRAERFLFFFTAIESLLSSDNKGSPVTDTIARRAAVILYSTPDTRADMAGFIKNLYKIRSNLVHRGKRLVSFGDANNIQYIAEAIYSIIFEEMTLEEIFTDFEKDLTRSGYGLPWPPSSNNEN